MQLPQPTVKSQATLLFTFVIPLNHYLQKSLITPEYSYLPDSIRSSQDSEISNKNYSPIDQIKRVPPVRLIKF